MLAKFALLLTLAFSGASAYAEPASVSRQAGIDAYKAKNFTSWLLQSAPTERRKACAKEMVLLEAAKSYVPQMVNAAQKAYKATPYWSRLTDAQDKVSQALENSASKEEQALLRDRLAFHYHYFSETTQFQEFVAVAAFELSLKSRHELLVERCSSVLPLSKEELQQAVGSLSHITNAEDFIIGWVDAFLAGVEISEQRAIALENFRKHHMMLSSAE